MAIRPNVVYPGQVDTSDPVGYPSGAARNIQIPGDGTGTPWEERLVNDIFGFQQALLDAAGITPSDVPDKVGASDYLDAVLELINSHEFTAGIHISAGPLQVDQGVLVTAGGLQVANGLTVTSDGLSVADGLVVQTGSLSVLGGSLAVTGPMVIVGNSTLNGTLSVTGDATLGDTALDTTRINGLLWATSAFQANGPATLLGTLNVSGDATLPSIAGPSAFSGRATFNGGTRIKQTPLPDSDTGFTTAANGHFYHAVAILNPRTYTFDKATHAAGDWFEISWRTTGSTATVSDGSSTLVSLRDNTPGDVVAARFVHNGTDWKLMMRELRP